MKIVTWNINSIRARLDPFLDWLESEDPDVVCLQETKVSDQEFPEDELGDLGYDVAYTGQPSYNGVAIATKDVASEVVKGLEPGFDEGERRMIRLKVSGVRVVSVYVPNGQSLGSDKYRYKLEWLEKLRACFERDFSPNEPLVVCGDFNIAPDDIDVWSPLDDGLFMSPPERAAYKRLLDFGLVDAYRHLEPSKQQFTWWDYRGGSFQRNAGLRIDHMLVTKPLVPKIKSMRVDEKARADEKASDHAPVILELET